MPERLTTIFVHLNQHVTDVSDAVYRSLGEHNVDTMCDNCNKCTEHRRIASLLFVPNILLIMLKWFENVVGHGIKLHSNVHLRKKLTHNGSACKL